MPGENADRPVTVQDLCTALTEAGLPSDLRKVLRHQFVYTYTNNPRCAIDPTFPLQHGVTTVRIESIGLHLCELHAAVRGCLYPRRSDEAESKWVMVRNGDLWEGCGLSGTLAPLP